MKEKDKLYTFYKLKEVERTNKVKERQESSAEHTYSCIILAKYFLNKTEKIIPEEP
jgi:5'-deoxynucleotidase YfbR-like HD superfamily hydrolase